MSLSPRVSGSSFLGKTVRLALLALVLLGIAGAAVLLRKRQRGVHPFEHGEAFVATELGRAFRLFDLGVADVDGDRRLDVFTVNHSNRQLLLLARADGSFEERLVELGLSQVPEFPGAESGRELPALERPGLYVYWDEERLIVRVSADFAATGQIELPRPLSWEASAGASVSAPTPTSLRFELSGTGSLEISADEYDFGPRFRIDEEVALASVFVGPRCVNPVRHEFALPTQDRHAMAWCDLDGDGDQDVFVARGGGVGRLQELEPDARDELFLFGEGSGDDSGVNSGAARFEDATERAGFEKLGCPARSVRWVDATGDGLLDLFVVCGRAEPPGADAPNQLFVQGPPGKFRERAAELGLDTPGLGLAHWLDVGQDGDMDLFWASRTSVSLFRAEAGAFHEQVLVPAPGEALQLSAGDFDQDGDLDVFLASTLGSRLFRAEGESFEVLDPGALGLPAQSFAVNWVDHDNDGLLDLHLLPQGLFRQESIGTFRATGLLSQRRSGIDALGSWFDADGDGFRDYLVSVPDWTSDALQRLEGVLGRPHQIRPRTSRVLLYRNVPRAPNAWLQIELVGPAGNRAALGARVELHSAAASTTAEVGQAEGSMRSQGHTRLYFGLGPAPGEIALEVVWPDGTRRRIENPALRQLLVVEYEG